MRPSLSILFVSLIVGSVLGCAGEDPVGAPATTGGGGGVGGASGGFLASCDLRESSVEGAAGRCRDWSGAEGPDLEVSCDGIDGVYSETEMCPEEGRVGRCRLDEILGVSATFNYYEPEWTAQTASDHCAKTDEELTQDLNARFIPED